MDVRQIVNLVDRCMDLASSAIPSYANAVQCETYESERLDQIYDKSSLRAWWNRPDKWGKLDKKNLDYLGKSFKVFSGEDEPRFISAGRAMAVGLFAACEEAIALVEVDNEPIRHVFDLLHFLGILQSFQPPVATIKALDVPETHKIYQDLTEKLRDLATTIPAILPVITDEPEVVKLIEILTNYINTYFNDHSGRFVTVLDGDYDKWMKIQEGIQWIINPENAPYFLQAKEDMVEIVQGASYLPQDPDKNLCEITAFQMKWLRDHDVDRPTYAQDRVGESIHIIDQERRQLHLTMPTIEGASSASDVPVSSADTLIMPTIGATPRVPVIPAESDVSRIAAARAAGSAATSATTGLRRSIRRSGPRSGEGNSEKAGLPKHAKR